MELSKTMLSCEDKAGKIATNFSDIGKAFQSIGLLDKLEKELIGDNGAAAVGIKNAIQNKYPYMEIINTLKQMLADGWQGLSSKLSIEIINF